MRPTGPAGRAWALLNAAGVVPPVPYPTDPVPSQGVPRAADFCFWGGLWGAAFGLALPRLPRAPLWLLGLGGGIRAGDRRPRAVADRPHPRLRAGAGLLRRGGPAAAG